MRKIYTFILFILFLFPISTFSVIAAQCNINPDICINSEEQPTGAITSYFKCNTDSAWWCRKISIDEAKKNSCSTAFVLKNEDGTPGTPIDAKEPWMDVSEACFLKAGIELKNGHPDDLPTTETNRKTCDSFASGKTITNYNWVICSACYKAGFKFDFFGSDPAKLNTSCKVPTGFLGLKNEFNQPSRAVREFLEMQGYDDAVKKGQLMTSADTPILPTSTSGTYEQPPANPQKINVCGYLARAGSVPLGSDSDFGKCNTCMSSDPPGVWTSLGCIKAADPYAFVGQIITWATILGAGLATAIIGFQGLQIVMSGDDPKKVKGAQEAITAAISGLLLIVFSIMLMNILGIKVLNITNLGFWKFMP